MSLRLIVDEDMIRAYWRIVGPSERYADRSYREIGAWMLGVGPDDLVHEGGPTFHPDGTPKGGEHTYILRDDPDFDYRRALADQRGIWG